MNSEEILKNIPTIIKDLESKKPDLLIKFSVFKKQVNVIPKEAETTPKKVFLYLNASNGNVSFTSDNKPYIEHIGWSEWESYAEYSKKYDGIIVSNWTIPGIRNISSKNFFSPSDFNTAYKMSLNFSFVVDRSKNIIGIPTKYDYRTRKFIKEKKAIIAKLSEYKNNNPYLGWALSERTVNLSKCFKEMFGLGLIGGNSYTNFEDTEHISKFLSYKEPVVRDTPRQRLVNELLEIKLNIPKMKFNKSGSKLICVASKVNEEYSALRWFMDTGADPYEISRLYVNKKSHIFCRKNTKGEYVVLNNKLTSSSFDSQKVIIQDKDAFKGTKLEYFESIYKELEPKLRGSALYMLTAFPEFEKFYKAGMNYVCIEYLNMLYQCSWPNYLESTFGKINVKEKNLNKILGFNRHQLELINEASKSTKKRSYYWCNGIGKEIKNLLEMDDCSSLDNSCFDPIFNVLKENKDWYMTTALKETISTYSLKVCINMISTLKSISGKVIKATIATNYGRTYESTQQALSVYADYVRTVRLLDCANRMRPHFTDLEDLARIHDDAVAVYNLKRDAADLENFKKRIPFWKKWEYDKNDKFIVVVPTLPEDLANEGITLHHCVKSYIQRVAAGSTNIVFIRQKDKPEEPFFTVEVGNKGDIEQVHGFANRNACTEPGLEDFVKEWAKERKLNAKNYNKVR